MLAFHCATTEVEVLAPLTVVSIGPSHGAIGIDPSTTVVMTFARPLDASTVTSASCYLSALDAGGAPTTVVDATRSVSDDAGSVVLTPMAPLGAVTRYRLTLTTAIADLDGEHLPTVVIAEFTTL